MNSSRPPGRRLHPADIHRTLFAVARALGSGDDHARGAVVDQAIVEQMQRLAHEARALMVIDVERLAHDRDRIHRGVLAKRDRHRGERAAVGAVALEVAARDQRGAGAGRGHAEHRILAMTATRLARAFAIAAAAHHGPPQSREKLTDARHATASARPALTIIAAHWMQLAVKRPCAQVWL